MITLKQILPQICPGDWFMSLDLNDAYFHIQVAPHHRRFLRFAFKGVAYQYKVLPFGLSLAARTFTRLHGCSSLPSATDGNPHTQLPRRLTDSGPVPVLTSHKTLLFSHLDCLGLRVNFAKRILSPSQRVSFLGTAMTIQRHAALHQGRYHLSAQSFPENTGPYGSSFAGTSVGPVSHATHPGRHRVTVTRACVSALAYWRDPSG